MLRTFIAVEISTEVRRAAAALVERLRAAGGGVSWVAPQSMHLTLKFLGDVAEERIAEVCAATAEAVRDLPRFSCEVAGAGAFPRVQRPNVLWLGFGQGAEELADLAGRVDKAMRSLGFPKEERPFHPHLTLGRVRHGGPGMAELARLLRENTAYHAGHTPVDEVVVFSSNLRPTGAMHTPLARAPLTGR